MLPLKRDSVRHLGQPADRRPIRTEASGCFTLCNEIMSQVQYQRCRPLIDARSDPLATADPVSVRALRDAVFGSLRSVVVPALPLVDRVARQWLARSTSPYLAELDAIAARTRISGIYAINLSYEYGCTTLARADMLGLPPTLRRTLDWPFLGLGRAALVAHRSGPAGAFYDVTWPGAAGTLFMRLSIPL